MNHAATFARDAFLSEAAQITDAAAWRKHVADAAKQPQVSGDLLATGYDHDDLVLDLYGTSSKDGIEVEDVTLTGDTCSLAQLFSGKQLEDMGYWCERKAEQEYRDGALDRALDAGQERSEMLNCFVNCF